MRGERGLENEKGSLKLETEVEVKSESAAESQPSSVYLGFPRLTKKAAGLPRESTSPNIITLKV